MSDKLYPPFRTSRDIDVRFAPQVGIIGCTYQHLVRTFGQPTFSTENNDTFEGTEQCSWHVQFQNGAMATIAENRGFGMSDSHFEKTTSWKINSRDTNVYNWIKDAIRDSNPNG